MIGAPLRESPVGAAALGGALFLIAPPLVADLVAPVVAAHVAEAETAAIWARLAGIAALAPVLALLTPPQAFAWGAPAPFLRSGLLAVSIGAALAGVWVAVVALLSHPTAARALAPSLAPMLLAGGVLVLQAATEELLFRRLAPRAFRSLGAPVWLWVAAPALLFAAVHYPPQPTDPAGAAAWARLIAAALFFAALAESRFGLPAAIAAHATLNAAALALGGASEANDPTVAAGGAALFLIMAAMVAGLPALRAERAAAPRKPPCSSPPC